MLNEKSRQVDTEVSLTFSRASEGWHVDLRDARSCLTITRLTLTDEEMGGLIGTRPVTVSARVTISEDIGRKMEVTQREVPMSRVTQRSYSPTAWGVEIAVWAAENGMAPYQSDWRPDVDAQFNHHRMGATGYMVTFRRWVEA